MATAVPARVGREMRNQKNCIDFYDEKRLDNVKDCVILGAWRSFSVSALIILKVRLGPLVSLEVTGENCKEICDALKGYEDLNKQIDSMCSDLSERVYPEGVEAASKKDEEAQDEI